MKFKYYLRGAGIGIFITVIIFSIANAILPSTMTDNQIIAEARKLGMVMADESSNTVSESIEKQQATKNTKENSKKETNKTDNNENNNSDDNSNDALTNDNEANIGESNNEESIPFVILPGQSSTQIVSALKASKIIDDAADFNSFLENNGYDANLQPGTFTLNNNMTYDEIAKILTTKNN